MSSPDDPNSHGSAPGEATHFVHEQGGGTQLAQMANDIGNFFRSEPDHEDAITGIANHISRYWTKRMREKLAAHLQHLGLGQSGLDPLPLAALQRLQTPKAGTPVPAPKEPTGGDAG
jgi:formate dehydrogenase subunit delta